MAVVKLWSDADALDNPHVHAVFEDIRLTRKSAFINNFWRALANQPEILARTWTSLKAVMLADGPLDPLTREMIYIAVSTANNCGYCIHSHTAAAKAKGMEAEQHQHLLAIIAMASQTNALATALQVPVDPEFQV